MHFRIVNICLILTAALPFSAAKGQAAKADGPDLEQRKLAVSMVRAINTAEMAYRNHAGGAFAGWADLSGSSELDGSLTRLSRGEPKLKNANLSSPDEILPGWRLRLTVSEDHKSYTIMLINTLDRCSHIIVSDQDGIIREGSAIGCPSSRSSADSGQPIPISRDCRG